MDHQLYVHVSPFKDRGRAQVARLASNLIHAQPTLGLLALKPNTA